METLLAIGIFLALLFNFVNGLNDAANSIATVVATRVLSPVRAVAMAAFFNMAGPFVFTTVVAKTIGKGIVDPGFLIPEVIVIGLGSAVLWVFLSSYAGIPISASHALVGGLIGSALAWGGIGSVLWPSMELFEKTLAVFIAGGVTGALLLSYAARRKHEEHWVEYTGLGFLCGASLLLPPAIVSGVLPLKGILAIIVFIVVSPVLGLVSAYLLGMVVIRLFRNSPAGKMNALFSRLQVFSAAFYSLGHGSNDAQNAMGVITALLFAAGILTEFVVPPWVIIVSGLAIALGTFLGGWRVVETMGRKITKLRPYQGFCAETGGGVVLSFVTAFGVPVSTTHAISGSIMGIGATRGYSAVQWGIVRKIVTAWILTIPLTATCGYIAFLVFRVVFSF
ncbi:MAG TPA: inorganic phosphate transporter [Methanolinea sp.]|jgi:PiT family inorganic phosphate transporter|nr:inorganic phosphate transporter [Methanolinea sp.]HOS82719.1 inorganic phosphate transporter [Methanolinea sp.]HPC55871.1 inorganic phosphate transporter [Methanolinea sp.]HQE86395.1 inorganic phosphate transporter [Methanolinea sp.]HQI15143.1 inorganic phosphate transporter [Methanolinea sp.]